MLATAPVYIIQPSYLSQAQDKHISVFYISLPRHWLFYLPEVNLDVSALSSPATPIILLTFYHIFVPYVLNVEMVFKDIYLKRRSAEVNILFHGVSGTQQ